MTKILGLLFYVSFDEDDKVYMSVEKSGVTAKEALDHVKAFERKNITFDSSDLDAASTTDALIKVNELSWPAMTDGQVSIDSIWLGGLKDQGIEWRFVPVANVDSDGFMLRAA